MTLAELETLVTKLQTDLDTLQGKYDTLKDSVATLDTKVSDDFLQKLQDVTINNITFGDILQYGSDGKWHNIQPSTLGITSGGSSGTATTLASLSDVIINGQYDGQVLTYSSTNGVWINKDPKSSQAADLSGYLTISAANATYLPLTGGTVEWLIVKGATALESNVEIGGDLLVDGGITMYNN